MFLNFVFYKGFENKENCFLKSKNYYCSLNLTFYVFFFKVLGCLVFEIEENAILFRIFGSYI